MEVRRRSSGHLARPPGASSNVPSPAPNSRIFFGGARSPLRQTACLSAETDLHGAVHPPGGRGARRRACGSSAASSSSASGLHASASLSWRATHSTANRAPWHVNPAPNDDSHHQPPGALSSSAASITKYNRTHCSSCHNGEAPLGCNALAPRAATQAILECQQDIPASGMKDPRAERIGPSPARSRVLIKMSLACCAASFGTALVKMFRSIPSTVLKLQRLALQGSINEAVSFHSLML